jgi:hypothetical protein
MSEVLKHDLDELLAQAELVNDEELVAQLRAKKARAVRCLLACRQLTGAPTRAGAA